MKFFFKKISRSALQKFPQKSENRPKCQETEPKPQEDVDFLIDDIDRQNALCIVILYGSGRTIFLEGAFGHTWKDTGHGINSIFGL